MKNLILNKYVEMCEALMEHLPPLEERKKQIEALSEEYIQEVGEQLPPFLLERLGTWFLQEVYSDNRSNKACLEEYPVLSEHQLYRRERKRVLVEEESTLDAINYHKINNSNTHKRGTHSE